MAAQGDFIIIRVDEIPADVEEMESNSDSVTIAHSETGHDHVMERSNVKAYKPKGQEEKDIYELFLNVSAPTEIKHLRSFDTHESIMVTEGKYMVRRQREYTPEGFRRAAD